MSKIGKINISIPEKVKVAFELINKSYYLAPTVIVKIAQSILVLLQLVYKNKNCQKCQYLYFLSWLDTACYES